MTKKPGPIVNKPLATRLKAIQQTQDKGLFWPR